MEKYIIIKNYTNNVEKYYLSSSILLMPSLYEGWSMVMNEAMEYGLPLITFDLNCSHEIITNGKSGFIVENYNKEKYVKCMLELANDKNKLKRFSQNTIEISKIKSNDRILNEWNELIKSLK